jgi:hypothetical protein
VCGDETTNAERLTKHREGVATRLRRIELALEDLRTVLDCVLAERQRASEGEVPVRRRFKT